MLLGCVPSGLKLLCGRDSLEAIVVVVEIRKEVDGFVVGYQRVSPDCLPISNGRKSNSRTCKEDDVIGENGRTPSSFEGKTSSSSRYRSTTTPSPNRDNHHNFTSSSSHVNVSDEIHKNLNHEASSPSPSRIGGGGGGGGGSGDVLLQWGHNKRSRGSRAAENRVVSDESSGHSKESRQVVKVHKRVERQTMLPPPPPCASTSYSKGGNLRSSMPSRETSASLLNRNLEDRSPLKNASPSRNKPMRSVEKRSSPDKPENKVGFSSSMANGSEKPNGSSPQGDHSMSHVESSTTTAAPADHYEPSSHANNNNGGEKVNLDMFEWPRIYISLSRKEKEDDFFAMKGTKLPQRPKKRAKNVDKTLQFCFPGMWLSDLTRSRYEVREKKCVKKQKRRGLKGMESLDSGESD
ncbi:hypothetical protein GIB67_035304 [Kingdonia uniflora]|uniref:Uncharacterized protein n=1 Tax=Kingdonia uniflora TaxID=39325 RepID=A0A7J7KY00_9MAGN|nr:hypothetical protein GIB67_035304 [Kingdonia uniflora]